MPHDFKNQLLEIGDEVIFRGKVVNVQAHDDYCNITIETIHPAKPFDNPTAMRTFIFNAAQLEKVTEVRDSVEATASN